MSRLPGARRFAARLLLALAFAVPLHPAASAERLPAPAAGEISRARALFEARRSRVWLTARGEVVRILGDDLKGTRHQRFIIRLFDGHTLLVAHNIDVAPRVPVEAGHEVVIHGLYEWNRKGGVLHWTHRDPAGRRAGGWVRHFGKAYR